MLVEGMQTKEDSYEQEPLGRARAAKTLFASLASTLADVSAQPSSHQCDPHGSTATWQTRRLCGRWLAARRLQAGIADAEVANQTGVDAQMLRLVEIGLVDTPAYDDARWERLVQLLVDRVPYPDADFVMAVVQGALGNCDWLTDAALERLADDLRTIAKEAGTP